ncbi:YrdB family protein [uncultured Eudoraea sp.]|uniref:YrdB family protein n=1 Tax=uncultured Eudoraea sp. TaxID=1035614 RepID=UPI002621B7A2|nr:YrdB family protein [uncultured Eudoraea sp.]
MGSHPINLIVRFLLELVALTAFGIWGWRQADGWASLLLAMGIPILMAVIWGTFAVPDDPSRSGAAPIMTPGAIRLLLELGFFAFAIWCFKDLGLTRISSIYGICVVIHYIVSYDRIKWLLKH